MIYHVNGKKTKKNLATTLKNTVVAIADSNNVRA